MNEYERLILCLTLNYPIFQSSYKEQTQYGWLLSVRLQPQFSWIEAYIIPILLCLNRLFRNDCFGFCKIDCFVSSNSGSPDFHWKLLVQLRWTMILFLHQKTNLFGPLNAIHFYRCVWRHKLKSFWETGWKGLKLFVVSAVLSRICDYLRVSELEDSQQFPKCSVHGE